MKRETIAVVTLILAFLIAGLALHTFLQGQPRAPLVFSAVAAALITFFWFLTDFRAVSAGTPTDESPLRRAVAGSIVVEYLVLVSIVAFWEDGSQPLPQLTQTLLTNFTTVVGVVIAFYFGSSAYVEAKKRSDTKSDTRSETNKA